MPRRQFRLLAIGVSIASFYIKSIDRFVCLVYRMFGPLTHVPVALDTKLSVFGVAC